MSFNTRGLPWAVVTPVDGDSQRGTLIIGQLSLPCALGRSGVRRDKCEGDGATPIGEWPIRRVLYRPDRLQLPPLGARHQWPMEPILPTDGWCDAPADPNYNRRVVLPYPASAERMWRDDHLYDVVMVLGHNDSPPVRDLGSAIFLHVARADYTPTEGCVALSLADLLTLLEQMPAGVRVLAA